MVVDYNVRRGDIVTIVDNLTGEEFKGRITAYTPDSITLEQVYDAYEYHFKDGNKRK